MSILICRPKQDAEKLIKLFSAKNVATIAIPTLEISHKDFSLNLANYTDIIFTSKYAVREFNLSQNDISTKNVWSIGESTAKELSEYNISAKYPKKSNSQELFKLIKQQDITTKSFLIVAGEGGNDLLLREISKLTTVAKLEVYKRVFRDSQIIATEYNKYFAQKQPEMIIATSIDVFRALNQIFEQESVAKPKQAFITISSTKMLQYLSKYDFCNTLKLEQLDNESICQQVCDFIKRR